MYPSRVRADAVVPSLALPAPQSTQTTGVENYKWRYPGPAARATIRLDDLT